MKSIELDAWYTAHKPTSKCLSSHGEHFTSNELATSVYGVDNYIVEIHVMQR